MSITIPRFEVIPNTNTNNYKNPTAVNIKDHLTDKYILSINLFQTQNKNTELAEKTIQIIEKMILESDSIEDGD